MAKELLGQLEIIDYKLEDMSLELVFLLPEKEEIREVKLYKGVFDRKTQKWSKEEAQAEKFKNNLKTYLGVTEAKIESILGKKVDVWQSDNGYCYLWEPEDIQRFDLDYCNQVLRAFVKDVVEYDAKLVIKLDIDGETYASNMSYGKWVAAQKKSFPNPIQKKKQIEKFEEKFQISWEEKESLVGTEVFVTVKKNNLDTTGKNPTFIEINALPKKKGAK